MMQGFEYIVVKSLQVFFYFFGKETFSSLQVTHYIMHVKISIEKTSRHFLVSTYVIVLNTIVISEASVTDKS